MAKRKPTFMQVAHSEAIRSGCRAVGPEHILLALASERANLASRVLASRGVAPQSLRGLLASDYSRTSDVVGDAVLPQSPEAKQAIEDALSETRALGHDYTGPEHLLLGLLRPADGAAARTLRALGVDPEVIRALIKEELRGV
jgi:ATP-dependent Clp protease ATP-binding subunit ClpC